jgi:hypothetical protein
MAFNLAEHSARAASVRYDPNFVKVPASGLLGLVDFCITACRSGAALDTQTQAKLKPYCMAADAHAHGRGDVALRCEDYYWLVKLAESLDIVACVNPVPLAAPWGPSPQEPATAAAVATSGDQVLPVTPSADVATSGDRIQQTTTKRARKNRRNRKSQKDAHS